MVGLFLRSLFESWASMGMIWNIYTRGVGNHQGFFEGSEQLLSSHGINESNSTSNIILLLVSPCMSEPNPSLVSSNTDPPNVSSYSIN